MRVLVTGSRDWLHDRVIFTELDHVLCDGCRLGLGDWTLVHGACPGGADAIADLWWLEMHLSFDLHAVELERHPADWCLGRRAGLARNSEMVDLGADLCLAFIRNYSPGATNCASQAAAAGIPTRIFREDADGNYLGEVA